MAETSQESKEPTIQVSVMVSFLMNLRQSALMNVDSIESCLIQLGRDIERTSEIRRAHRAIDIERDP